MRILLYSAMFLSSHFFCSTILFGQDKVDIKFGKVGVQDFDLSKYSFDTTAGAVYIADVGSSKFKGNNKGWFTLVFKRQYRLKILSTSGFQLATEGIPVYQKDGQEEVVDDLKATTYNIENGEVVTAKLDRKSIFNDKLGGNWKLKKFTLPSVKVGSIIEVSYTIETDFLFQLKPWNFQGEFPILWSEYNAEIPDFFNYLFLQQGYQKFHINSTKVSMQNFLVKQGYGANASSNVSVTAGLTTLRWVMKDVPPLKEEKFTTTTENYISKIEFQLSQIRLQQPPEDILGNWFKTSVLLMKDKSFGKELNEDSSWLNNDMKSILGETTGLLDKSKKIHAFVRDYFTCTDRNEIYLSKSLKDVFKEKNGNVADLNLLLVLMLKHEGIEANPVLLSTRAHGFSHPFHPILDKYNYVVAKATINGNDYYLDASEPRLGFNYLPLRCYNGDARLIGKLPIPVFFYPDSVHEHAETIAVIKNDGKSKWKGQVSATKPYYESLELRNEVAKNGQESYFKSFLVQHPSDYTISGITIDSIDHLEEPVRLRYNIDINVSDQPGLVYFDPLLGEGYKDNYFKAASRKYPVEIPYTIDESYQLTMEIPLGYAVEELPRSGKQSLKEGGGSFEYFTENKGNTIVVRSHLIIEKANFKPEEYNDLRKLFDFVVKKHNEQIVFKKN